jgi:hypothetical protein
LELPRSRAGSYATLIEQLTARIAELEREINESLQLTECCSTLKEMSDACIRGAVAEARVMDLEAELANERGIKEQFKAALAHQEELEAQLAQREEPIAETCSHCHGQSPVNAFGLCGECSRMLSEFVQRQSAAEARTRVAES